MQESLRVHGSLESQRRHISFAMFSVAAFKAATAGKKRFALQVHPDEGPLHFAIYDRTKIPSAHQNVTSISIDKRN